MLHAEPGEQVFNSPRLPGLGPYTSLRDQHRILSELSDGVYYRIEDVVNVSLDTK